jgi:hypothetical protein
MRAPPRVFSQGIFDPGTGLGSADTTSEPADAARSDATGDDQFDHSESVTSRVDWHELVARIRTGDNSGLEDLYGLFARGIRFYLCRQLGPQELDDKVHDAFLIVVQAIERGDLREPERLMGFVRTVVRRQVAAISMTSFIAGEKNCIWTSECGWPTDATIPSKTQRSSKRSNS